MVKNNDKKTYLNSRGEKVFRVSEIIKSLNKEQIAYWSNSLGFKRISYKLELMRTANIGTAIHWAIEELNKHPGKEVHMNYEDFSIRSIQDMQEVTNGVNSYIKWKTKHSAKLRFLHHELSIVGEDFGGTLDAVIESFLSKDGVVLIDYKTSSAFRLTQFLQLAAYCYLYEKYVGGKVDAIMIIRMDKKVGKIAEEKVVLRKDLDIFIELFRYLFLVTKLNLSLEESLNLLTHDLSDL